MVLVEEEDAGGDGQHAFLGEVHLREGCPAGGGGVLDCKQEGITLTDDDYTAYINEMFENFGVANEEEFQAKANMTLDAYVKAYDVKVNMFAGKLLDKIVAEKTGETGEAESEG